MLVRQPRKITFSERSCHPTAFNLLVNLPIPQKRMSRDHAWTLLPLTGTLQQAVLSEAAANMVVAIPLLLTTKAWRTADWRLVVCLTIFSVRCDQRPAWSCSEPACFRWCYAACACPSWLGTSLAAPIHDEGVPVTAVRHVCMQAAGSPLGALLLTALDPRIVELVMALVLMLVIVLHVKLLQRLQERWVAVNGQMPCLLCSHLFCQLIWRKACTSGSACGMQA